MPFAPEYIRCVLRENFDDAKALFLDPLLAIHRAHLLMLADRGIVSGEDARTLRDGLDEEWSLIAVLSPRHFIEVRHTYGGPAPEETARALGVSESVLDADRAWLDRTRDGLEVAAAELHRRSAAL